jgi:uncharacterized surface protein with fasciclin (FAS1) repeats
MRSRKTLLATVVVGALVLAACGDDSDSGSTTTAAPVETTEAPAETTEAPAPEGPGTIVDIASGNPDFSTLVELVVAAGLADTLAGEGPFTVFAPTDEAFAALPEGLLDALLLPENKDILTQILLYHVVAGAAVTSDMVEPGEVTMADESVATLSAEGDALFINDAEIVTVDVMASNGVIHVIDAVIVPPGLDVAALLG